MPFKDKFIKRDYSREYMRNYRAGKKGLTVKPVKPNLLNPVKPTLVNPVVKPCPSCPTLKKQLENLTTENQKILTEKENIQKQLSELENGKPKVTKKEPKKITIRQPKDQPVKVDLEQLERETGLKKDWKNPAWNRVWKVKYNELYNQLPSTIAKKRLWKEKNGGR